MNAINIYMLSRITEKEPFELLERQLSKRKEQITAKNREIETLYELVDLLVNNGVTNNGLENYYFSFTIEQIGKEFDLLRVSDGKVINIELKSEPVSEDKIKEQLIKNRYYLSHLSREIRLYTYIKGYDFLYMLSNDELINIDVTDLIEDLYEQENCYCENINRLFEVSNFLVSPVNDCDKFIKGEYFLTQQQDRIKNDIKNDIEGCNSGKLFGIYGNAGTGKTLLLYDIAKEFSALSKCCLIHCGIFSDGHYKLNKCIPNLDFIEPKYLDTQKVLDGYDYIFLDEFHRIYDKQFNIIKNELERKVVVVAFDCKQVLSLKEMERDIVSKLKSIDGYKEFKLSNKIRTNKEVASFIKKVMNKKVHDEFKSYDSVDVYFAKEENECKRVLSILSERNYCFINFSSSRYNKCSFDKYYNLQDFDTHHVIGQEFDRVVMILDYNFYYNQDSGILHARNHPSNDYLFGQLFFQGITRVREKLALVVVGNYELFKDIIKILA